MGRLIQKIDIPTTLFDQAGQILHLPPQLVAKWVDLLNTHSLLERAKLVPPEGAYGGIGKEETDDHLAWRFTGSSARVMLAVLDPKEELLEVADAFAQIFSGNRVFLVDIPSGSGAVTVAILTIFAELRKQGRVPRIPLEVVVIGGEISPYGRSYFTEILNSLKDELSSQAIQITFEAIDWNVCDKFSNTELIKRLTLQSQNCTSRLLVLANFSAFLQKKESGEMPSRSWKRFLGIVVILRASRFGLSHRQMRLRAVAVLSFVLCNGLVRILGNYSH